MSDNHALDLLVGAPAIARYLQLKPRTVYHLAEVRRDTGQGPPIATEPGFGLVASRAGLRSYLEGRIGGPVEETSDES